MKVIEASQFGGPDVLTLKERATPEPGPGSLLIEVRAAGLNYADIMSRQGVYPSVPAAPFVPGFEVAGVIQALGDGVEGFKVGDTVAAITPSGGGYATHAVVPAAMAIPLPAEFDPATAVALLVQGIIAQILISQAGIKPGDTVLIAAASGGLGSIAVQLAKARGARVIGSPHRASWMQSRVSEQMRPSTIRMLGGLQLLSEPLERMASRSTSIRWATSARMSFRCLESTHNGS